MNMRSFVTASVAAGLFVFTAGLSSQQPAGPTHGHDDAQIQAQQQQTPPQGPARRGMGPGAGQGPMGQGPMGQGMMGPNMMGRMQAHQQQMTELMNRAVESAKALETETDAARLKQKLTEHLALLERMQTEMAQHRQMMDQMRTQMREHMRMMMGDTGSDAATPQQ